MIGLFGGIGGIGEMVRMRIIRRIVRIEKICENLENWEDVENGANVVDVMWENVSKVLIRMGMGTMIQQRANTRIVTTAMRMFTRELRRFVAMG